MTTSMKKPNKIVESIKKGLADIKMVLEEGNYKLFIKQMIVIILVFFGFRYYNGVLQQKENDIRGKIDAVQAQQNNEKEYLANKKKLLELEPRFPDMATKNDWLLRQIVSVFREANITPKLGTAQAEDTSNPAFTVAAIPVTFNVSYGDFGRFLAQLENSNEYLKVSEFTLTKSKESLGENAITMRINTIFPKEKIARTMFKDAKGGRK